MNQLLNKIKASLLIFISFIFAVIFLVEALQGHYLNQPFLSMIYLITNIGLITYGVYLWKIERIVNMKETLIVLFLLQSLAIIMISFDYATHIVYFPMLFLLALIYSVSIEKRKIFQGVNIFCIILIFIGKYILFQIDNSSYLVDLSSILLQCSIYISVVFVIRNYLNECLTCELKKDSCPFQNSCVFYQARWKNHF